MNPTCSTARPVIWLEPRAVHVWRPHDQVYRCQPLAYLPLPATPLAEALLHDTGWLHLREAQNALLLGENALALSQTIPGADEPRFPLEQGDLRGAPDEAWSTCSAILEDLLVDHLDSGELLCLVPSLCEDNTTLWLRALPEALLGDLHPNLQLESAIDPLFDPEPRAGLDWVWVIGDRGVSIGARHCGKKREAYVSQGCRSVLDKTAATTGLSIDQIRRERDHSPIRKTQEIYLRDLVQKVIAKSIPLFQDAWSGPIKPAIHVHVAAPAAIEEAVAHAIARATQEYGIESDTRWLTCSYPQLLDRASRTIEAPERPEAPEPSRPKAVRPRAL